METFLRHFKVSNPAVSHLRILINGQMGAGISSFVNSVDSAFQHRITARAPTAPITGPSFTKKFKSYRIKGLDGGTLPFILSDVRGFESGDSYGIHPNDVKNALLGHMQENYVFNPVSPLTAGDPGYISNPALSDKAHCLVSVMSAAWVNVCCNSTAMKLRSIWDRASDVGIPHVVIMTHVDKVCPLVIKDLKAIYKSRSVKERMQRCSNILHTPMNQIFPVKNYHEELETNDDMDILILRAMKHIINCANDYVSDLK